jgi:hypothetical protein
MPNHIPNVYPSTDLSIQRTLYKYRALNDEKSAIRLFEMLSENHLYFSDPKNFNDPFEIIKVIDINQPFLDKYALCSEKIESYVSRALKWQQDNLFLHISFKPPDVVVLWWWTQRCRFGL